MCLHSAMKVQPRTKTRAKRVVRAAGLTRYFWIWVVVACFANVVIEFGTERLIESSSQEAKQFGLLPSHIYQILVTSARAPIVSRTVIVEIDSKKEFPTVNVNNLCEEREFLSHLLDRIAVTNPAVIVVDKYFGRYTCPQEDTGTTSLISAVKRIREGGTPVVIGLKTEAIPGSPTQGFPADYIFDSLSFGDPNQEGISNIAEDNRHLALQWRVYAHKPKSPIVLKDTLALVSAQYADPNRRSKDPIINRFIMNMEQPFIGFLGSDQWRAAKAHFYASEIFCGPEVQRNEDWRRCLESQVPVPGSGLRSQIVVIGETDPNGNDLFFTVVGEVQGFYLQANYIEALMDRQVLAPAGQIWDYGIAFLFIYSIRLILAFRKSHWIALRRVLVLFLGMFLLLYVGAVNLRYYVDPVPIVVIPLVVALLTIIEPGHGRLSKDLARRHDD